MTLIKDRLKTNTRNRNGNGNGNILNVRKSSLSPFLLALTLKVLSLLISCHGH